jgi:hypothetical protein
LKLLSIIFPELLLLLLLQFPEFDTRLLDHRPVDLDWEVALIQAPPTMKLLSRHIIPLHKIVWVRITRDLGGDERLGCDKLVEGAVNAGLLLRVVWTWEAAGEVAVEAPI